MSRRWARRAASLLGLVLLGLCVWFLWNELRGLNVDELRRHLLRTPLPRLLMAAGWAVTGYVAITLYDVLALRYVGVRLSWGRTVFASFASNAFSNSVSLPVLNVGGTRFRFYEAWGVSNEKIARLIAFIGIGAWLGLLTLTGLGFVIRPPEWPGVPAVMGPATRVFGALLLATVAGYFAVCVLRRTVRLGSWAIPLPTPRMTLSQTAVGLIDWLTQAALVYVLLPDAAGVTLGWFLPIYFGAMFVTMFGAVPAGLGILDAGLLLMLQPTVGREPLIGVLILYRLIYHVIPLGIATIMLAGFEVRQRMSAKGEAG